VKLKEFLLKSAISGKRKIDHLSIIFCGDAYLLEINKQYLQHDFYTDIITFDLSEKRGLINAEIYISIDRVKDNAYKLHTSFNQEIHRVIFHGLLHLLGYKDKSVRDQKAMRLAEEELLSRYFHR
jgi:rRNA maturation RNase YbeY